jgi:hypothetical protein
MMVIFRMTSGPGVEARWSCPNYKEHGCTATFSTRIAISEEDCVPEDVRFEYILVINIFLAKIVNFVDVSQPSTVKGVESIESENC